MTDYEMLDKAVTDSWRRLQEAYDVQDAVYQKVGALELFTNNLEGFKALSRNIVECERLWRRAMEQRDRAARLARASQPRSAAASTGAAEIAQPSMAAAATAVPRPLPIDDFPATPISFPAFAAMRAPAFGPPWDNISTFPVPEHPDYA